MANYLEQYDPGGGRRERSMRIALAVLLVLLFVVAPGWYLFKNHRQEARGKGFASELRKGAYKAAYGYWCTPANPCPGYSFEKFMEDWGTGVDPRVVSLDDSESCGSGVILTLKASAMRQEKLWVEKSTGLIGFSPVPHCPSRSSYSIMIHETLGKLRKPFLK